MTYLTNRIGWRRLRQIVWNNYNTSRVGSCYTCNGIIRNDMKNGWHCSHVIARKNGGEDTLINLRACCPKCNLRMGTKNLYVYKRSIDAVYDDSLR